MPGLFVGTVKKQMTLVVAPPPDTRPEFLCHSCRSVLGHIDHARGTRRLVLVLPGGGEVVLEGNAVITCQCGYTRIWHGY